jgi:hypothetical protein
VIILLLRFQLGRQVKKRVLAPSPCFRQYAFGRSLAKQPKGGAMLRETFAALTTPATGPARRFGHAHEGIAIEARFRRCYTDWAPHIGRCRQAIVAAAASTPRRDRVVVLGSGPLCDIPLARLAEMFADVILVDAFHPPRARAMAARHANVRRLDIDLLGLARHDGRLDLVTGDDLRSWRDLAGPADLVISANLLAQLPLSGDGGGVAGHAVMAAHLADLAAGPGRVCLISEWRRRWFDAMGQLLASDLPLAGLDLPPYRQGWVWTVAPPGELSGGASLVADVGWYDQPLGPSAL